MEAREAAPIYTTGNPEFQHSGLWDTTSHNLALQARSGVTMAKVHHIREALGFSPEELASLLHVSLRTLQRRQVSDVMSVPVSERILQLEKLLQQGEYIFEEPDAFQGWLREPVLALGGDTPYSLLDTQFGIRLVSQVLGRLAFGVYA